MNYKNNILKTILVLTCLLGLMMCPGGLIIALFVEEKIAFLIIKILIICFLISGFAFIILLPILGGIDAKTEKATKIPLFFTKYEHLEEYLKKELEQRSYFCANDKLSTPKENVQLYIKPQNLCTLNCVALIHINELSNDYLEFANDEITQILSTYYNSKKITNMINMISIICVNRTTPAFYKFVNSNCVQGFKNGRLNIGASFGGKNVYIAPMTDGYAIMRYKKLRKEFYNIMQINKR